MVPAVSDRISRVPPYSGVTLVRISLPVRGYHPLRPAFPDRSRSLSVSFCVILLPRNCRNSSGLGSVRFDRHYSGHRCFFLFLQVLRCFSSLRLLRLCAGAGPSTRRVPPFGHARIDTCLQFPAPFRSLPRPSSPPEAQASPVRSCNLLLSEFRYFRSL